MCQLRSSSLIAFDMSTACEDPMWGHEDGPSMEVLMGLNTEIDALASYLRTIVGELV
jgi:hypothetical protein